MKIIVRIVLGLVLVLIALLVGIQIAVNRPFFREKIIKIASEKLQREVTLGRMSLSFFPSIGLNLKKFDIREKSKNESLMSFENLKINIQVFPLLRKELIISASGLGTKLQFSFHGRINLPTQDIVLQELRLNVGTSDIIVTGQIKDLEKAPIGDLIITSRFLDVAEFLNLAPHEEALKTTPEEAIEESTPIRAPTQAPTGPENPLYGNELFQKTRFTLSILLQKVQYRENTLSNVLLKARLDQGILDMSDLSLSAYDGKISGVLKVNLQKEKIGYDLAMNVASVQLKKATQANLDQGKVEGILTSQGTFKGTGLSKSDMQETLFGNAKIEVKEGKVLGTDLKYLLLSKMKNPILLQFLPGLSKMRKEAEAQKIKETPFQDFIIDLQVNHGIITLQKMNLRTKQITLRGNGQVDFNLQSDLEADAVFSKEFTESITGGTDLSNLIPHEGGGLYLDVKITGPLTKPKVMPNLATLITALTKGQLTGGAGKLLKGGVNTLTAPIKPLESILGGKETPQDEGSQDETSKESTNPLKKFKLF